MFGLPITSAEVDIVNGAVKFIAAHIGSAYTDNESAKDVLLDFLISELQALKTPKC